jgi:hypothetical protein
LVFKIGFIVCSADLNAFLNDSENDSEGAAIAVAKANNERLKKFLRGISLLMANLLYY